MAATPFLVVGAIALAGVAFGAFTVTLPFLFILAAVATGLAAVGLLVAFAGRRIAGRRGDRPAERTDLPPQPHCQEAAHPPFDTAPPGG